MRLNWSQRSRRRWLSLAALLLAGAAEPKLGDQALSVDAPEGHGTLPAFTSHSLLGRQPGVTRLLVIVESDAGEALALGKSIAGPDAAHTLVVAPQFPTQADAKRWSLPGDRLRWAGSNWADGLPAAGPRPISPFSALDSVLRSVADPGLLPDLKTIVVAGEGEGADLVQLYAASTAHLDGLTKRGLQLRFVVAEPQHYLYIDQARPAPTAACPGFNHWPYGLDGAPAYLDELGPASLFTQYRARDVVYLVGDASTAEPAGCEAAAQGPDPAARGRFYASYMAKLAGTPIQHLAIVPKANAAHGLLASSCGTAALFGRGDCPALAAAPDLPAFPDAAETPKPAPEAAKPEPAKPDTAPADTTPPAVPTTPVKVEQLPPPDQAKPDAPKPDQVAPDGLPDPLQDANPIGPLLTRAPPPQPKPPPATPPQ